MVHLIISFLTQAPYVQLVDILEHQQHSSTVKVHQNDSALNNDCYSAWYAEFKTITLIFI